MREGVEEMSNNSYWSSVARRVISSTLGALRWSRQLLLMKRNRNRCHCWLQSLQAARWKYNLRIISLIECHATRTTIWAADLICSNAFNFHSFCQHLLHWRTFTWRYAGTTIQFIFNFHNCERMYRWVVFQSKTFESIARETTETRLQTSMLHMPQWLMADSRRWVWVLHSREPTVRIRD